MPFMNHAVRLFRGIAPEQWRDENVDGIKHPQKSVPQCTVQMGPFAV